MQKFNFVPCVLYNFLIFVTSELFDAKTKESRFFLREFQPMASAPDDNSLLSDQDTNQFLM